MKAFKRWVSDGGRTLVVIGVIIAVIGGLFLFRLDSQTPGASGAEVAAAASARDFHQILDNPVYAPHKVLQFGLRVAQIDNLFSLRLVSALFALASVISFYFLMKLWTTPLIANLITLLYMTSSWFLHSARVATPGIMYGSVIILIALGVALQHSTWRKLNLLALLIASALALYVPGLIWFVIGGVIWRRKIVTAEMRKISPLLSSLYVVLFIVLLAPLALAVGRDPEVVKTLLGLPSSLPEPLEVIKQFVRIPINLLVRGPADKEMWLGRLPYLDIFSAAMFVSGLYVVCRKWQFDRSKLLVGILGLGSLLIAIGGVVQVSLLIPIVYALIGIGIAYMLEEWLSVFPRNPLARNIGIALVVIACSLTALYNVRHYFVAWHHAPATKAAYTQKIP